MIIINLSNIQKGAVFKSYKELCKALDEKPSNGNTKKAQFKEWERFFSYIREGNKITITEVFSEPKEKIDLRTQGNNKTHYIPTIEKLILDLLIQDENGQVFLSKNRLLKKLKMINDNYTYAQYKTLKLSKLMNITKQEIEDFYNTSSDTLIRNIESALNSLKKQSLIFWNHAITIAYIDTSVRINSLGQIKATRNIYHDTDGTEHYSYNVPIPDKNILHRKADDKEIKLILRYERELLEHYKCTDKQELFKIGKVDEFYKQINDQLFNAANIISYYNSYEILFNQDHISKKWEQLEEMKLKHNERKKLQNNLNKDVMNKINENAKRRHDRAIENEMEILFDDTERFWYRLDKTYISNNKKLTNTLINKNAESIRKDINNTK